MRSTQQYLAQPFEKGYGHRHERLARVEKAIGKNITPPENFLDAMTGLLMDNPCNIKQATIERADASKKIVKHKTEASDCYIDECTKSNYKTHPLHRDPQWEQKWLNGEYPADSKLSDQIEVWLTILEIKCYLRKMAEHRKHNPKTYLQINSSIEYLQMNGRQDEKLPDDCYSALTGQKLMTFPVILDGKDVIDFQELLDAQPQVSEEEQTLIIDRWQHYVNQCYFTLEQSNKLQLQHLATLSEETLPAKERQEIIDKATVRYVKEREAIKRKYTLEWFMRHIYEHKEAEYISPLSLQAVKSIAIDFGLMKKIDLHLDPIGCQIICVEENIRKLPEVKSYALTLSEKKFPEEKIPEALLIGRIPGTNRVEIMTHPVLLDGEYMIDYARLKEYWATKSIFRFLWDASYQDYNPFTGQLIKTIEYDHKLKSQTDDFMRNLLLHRAFNTQEEVRSGNYTYTCISMFARTVGISSPALASPAKMKV